MAEGCIGGFNYLIGGRYAQDQGLVAEECNPYLADVSNFNTLRFMNDLFSYVKMYHTILLNYLIIYISPFSYLQDAECTTDPSCGRTYVARYQYVGGYYGASNEENMMEALVSGGPLAVSIMTYDDFSHYSGGVYHHVESNRAEFDPFHVRLKIICIRNNNFVIFYLKIE